MRYCSIIALLMIFFSNAWSQENKSVYTIKQITEFALTKSEILKSKREEINEKKWLTAQSQKWQNPELSLKFGNNRLGADNSLNTEFSLTQPFYFPGKRNIMESILNGEQRKSEISLEETSHWVYYEVIYLSYAYILAKEYTNHIQEQKNRLFTIEKFLSNRPIASPQKIMEKNRIRQKMLLLEKEHLNNLTKQKVIWEKLNQYLQLPEPVEIKLSWFKKGTEIDFNMLFSKTIQKNYELQKQNQEILSAELNKALAEKEIYPDFSLSLFYSVKKSNPMEQFIGGGISFFLPVWDTGASKIKSMEGKIQSENYKKNFMIQNIKTNLRTALLEYQTKSQILKQFPVSLLKTVHQQMDFADHEFRKGRIELLSYLDAEESASQIHTEVFNSQMEYVRSYIEILMLSVDKDFQEGDQNDL